jgi:hypothetical protein
MRRESVANHSCCLDREHEPRANHLSGGCGGGRLALIRRTTSVSETIPDNDPKETVMTDHETLLETLTNQIGAGGIDQIAGQLGLGRGQVETVVGGALPMLLGGLTRNAESPDGAASLLGALERDHDGSILDDIGDFLGQGAGAADSGLGILKHVFGGREASVEKALAGSSGLDSASVRQILAMLAPLVMGMLGKTRRNQGLDLGGLTELLSGERRAAQAKAPEAASLIGSLLDSDGDGEVGDDLAKLGGSLLGGLFGKK